MTGIALRPARPDQVAALTELCLRSKAHWGYDTAFMAACREELTLRAEDLEDVIVAVSGARLCGVAQVSVNGELGAVEKLFVVPGAMGRGIGRRLFGWCRDTAVARGARTLRIEADPAARRFYERMGARVVGTAPSGSIPRRRLPLLSLSLVPETAE